MADDLVAMENQDNTERCVKLCVVFHYVWVFKHSSVLKI